MTPSPRSILPANIVVVQPVLRDGNWDRGLQLAGRVKTDFANIAYVKNLCRTPIRNDALNQGSTCLQIEHAGQAFLNYQRYLSEWDMVANSFGNGSINQSERPAGFGLLYENTTVTAQWINVVNTSEVSKQYGRAIST